MLTCVVHYDEGHYEGPNREEGSGKYLLGLLGGRGGGGLSRCSNSFPSLPGNEQKMLKERDISVPLVPGKGEF